MKAFIKDTNCSNVINAKLLTRNEEKRSCERQGGEVLCRPQLLLPFQVHTLPLLLLVNLACRVFTFSIPTQSYSYPHSLSN